MFGKLESLRGVAACLVILFHSPFNFGVRPLDFITNSYLFVDFFFILSGFVMAFAYGEKIAGSLSFGRYISLRLGRIYPLHLFMLIVWLPYILFKQYLFTSGFGGTDQFETSNLSSFLSNLLLMHSMGLHSYLSWNHPSWSISTEFFAYIFFYIITVTIDRKNNLYLPLIIVVACYAFLFNLDRYNFDITHDFGFIRCLGAFYLGVFLFRVRFVMPRLNTEALMKVLEVFSIACLITAVTYSNVSDLALSLTIASFALVLVVFSSSKSGYLGKLMEIKAMRHLGVWSYSIYLLHGLIVAMVSNVFEYIFKFDLTLPLGVLSIAINLFLFAVTVAASRYTYIHIEKRFRDKVKSKVMSFAK